MNALSQFRANRFGVNSMSPHDIAEKLGIHYSGDVNIEHGGTFYDSANWQQYGYANAVSVSLDDGHAFITAGTINRPTNKGGIADCLRCCGWSIDEETGDIVADYDGTIVAKKDSPQFELVEIEATQSHWGIETDTHRVCKLVEPWRTGSDRSDYFIDGGKNIPLDNLLGYVLSRYVIGHLETKCE